MSSRWVTHTLDLPERNRKVLEELAALKAKLRKPLADWWLDEVKHGKSPGTCWRPRPSIEGRT